MVIGLKLAAGAADVEDRKKPRSRERAVRSIVTGKVCGGIGTR